MRASFFAILLLNYFSAASSSPEGRLLSSVPDSQSRCIPSSCGNLHNISYPFRLRGDPKGCGRPEFELVCEGKNTVLYLDRHRYIVLNINYTESYITARVDCAFTTSTCPLHTNSSFLELNSNLNFGFNHPIPKLIFVNCSRTVQDKEYMVVQSLSDHKTTVYAVIASDSMFEFLPESCRFLDTFPSDYYYDVFYSSQKVLENLKTGLRLYYSDGYSLAGIVSFCYADALGRSIDGVDIDNGGYKYGLLKILLYIVLIEYNFVQCAANHYMSILNNSWLYRVFFFLQMYVAFLFVRTVVCRFMLVPLFVYAFLAYNCKENVRPIDDVEKFLRSQQNLSPTWYSFRNIIAMTSNFKERLGKGGFGTVFKGELLGGRLVAVKVLGSLKFSGEDFINEVSTISRIHHVNVVQLLGFCYEGTNRALVYEYMPNGSLDKYIFSLNGTLALEQLNKITLGIARGVYYLHRGCDMQILHFDIKPHNILLDHNFTPKISDFGLAKMYPRERSLVSVSSTRGTIGYIAPELISRNFGVISNKSDVYSFGMLLLDIAGRKRDFDSKMQNSSGIYYPSWIYNQLTQQEVPNFEEIIDITELERKLCKIGLWCIQMDSSKRPHMGKVIEMLETNEDHLEMSPKPFFSAVEERSGHSCMIPSSTELSVIIEYGDD